MSKSKRSLLLTMLLCICGSGVMAQNLNPSDNGITPYSRYGYGTLADDAFTASKGMGGIGIGMREKSQINVQNPASYTSIDSLTFLFDFGMNGQMSVFNEPGVQKTDWSAGIDYVAFQIPLGRKFAASAGVLPYSYVGYSYGNQDSISIEDGDNVAVTKKYNGKGGLNKVYVGFAYQPIKSLSVGINAGYIWGVTSNDWSMSYSGGMGTTSRSQHELYSKAFDLNFGLQYSVEFNKKNKATIGITYNPKMDMWTEMTGIMSLTTSDTTIVEHTVNIPQKFGVGISYNYNEKLILGADFKRELWGEVKAYDENYNLVHGGLNDRTKIALGAEYLPGGNYGDNYLKRIRYRVGFNYSDSYVKVKDSRNNEYAATIGFGLPLLRQKSMINIGLEYATIRPTNKNFLSENYLRLNIGLSFNEMWFLKNRLK